MQFYDLITESCYGRITITHQGILNSRHSSRHSRLNSLTGMGWELDKDLLKLHTRCIRVKMIFVFETSL